jgi:hypothetical protein
LLFEDDFKRFSERLELGGKALELLRRYFSPELGRKLTSIDCPIQ